MTKYIIGEIVSSIGATLYKNPQVSQSRFNPKSAPMEDLGAVLKPNIEPKLDEYHLYFF